MQGMARAAILVFAWTATAVAHRPYDASRRWTFGEGAFIREAGTNRVVLDRGINLAGSSKLPLLPDGATHLPTSLLQPRAASFVGRPFPLADGSEHLKRLRRWGFTWVRLVFTWEAVEHAGPGLYDEAYLTYLRDVVELAGSHGLGVVLDPHQDVWSRFTGGDGAPAWTLEAAGLRPRTLHPTAAFTHQGNGDPLPAMSWAQNYQKLGCATMFTLFFGGDRYAPRTTVCRSDVGPTSEDTAYLDEVWGGGERRLGIGTFLQGHYLRAVRTVAEAVAGCDNLLGFDTLNEPSPGFIGTPDLASPGVLSLGRSPLTEMAEAAGFAAPAPFGLPLPAVPPLRPSAWDARGCVWRREGVWAEGPEGRARLLRPSHFACDDFMAEFLLPFWARLAEHVGQHLPEAALFCSPPARAPYADPVWPAPPLLPVVFSPHWYDVVRVVPKRSLGPVGLAVGGADGAELYATEGGKRKAFAQAIRAELRRGGGLGPGVPAILGEVGMCFDLDGGAAYQRGQRGARGRERVVACIDAVLAALEEVCVPFAWWNYSPDNDHERGDGWNGEDFSIYSADDVGVPWGWGGDPEALPADEDAGGRGLTALVRPHARRVAGIPVRQRFHLGRRAFALVFETAPGDQRSGDAAITEVFVPMLHYGEPLRMADGTLTPRVDVVCSDGTWKAHDKDPQLLLFQCDMSRRVHTLRITPRAPRAGPTMTAGGSGVPLPRLGVE